METRTTKNNEFDTKEAPVRYEIENGDYVGVTVFPFDGGFWFLDFAAPAGTALDPGAYENVTWYGLRSTAASARNSVA